MRWKRILLVAVAAVALALSLYAISLAHSGIRMIQTSETDRAERREAQRFRTAELQISVWLSEQRNRTNEAYQDASPASERRDQK
jgi:uncharacterized membrane protein